MEFEWQPPSPTNKAFLLLLFCLLSYWLYLVAVEWKLWWLHGHLYKQMPNYFSKVLNLLTLLPAIFWVPVNSHFQQHLIMSDLIVSNHMCWWYLVALLTFMCLIASGFKHFFTLLGKNIHLLWNAISFFPFPPCLFFSYWSIGFPDIKPKSDMCGLCFVYGLSVCSHGLCVGSLVTGAAMVSGGKFKRRDFLRSGALGPLTSCLVTWSLPLP